MGALTVVQHNMLSMFSNRQLGIISKKKDASVEKLSSGYKINRSADDAAGLSMSEKMRREVRGLMQGKDNIQDGISLVQVADGALDEVVDCLQRINELSIRAYNGTSSESDRNDIQNEINGLVGEIGRIAETTKFNEIKVLKGDPTVEVTIQAERTEEVMIEVKDYTRNLPPWLLNNVSNQLSRGNFTESSYSQDTSHNAIYMQTDGSYKYYGPHSDSLDNLYGQNSYGSPWTNTLNDNASAVLDFGKLDTVINNSAANDCASDLYAGVLGLLGCAIGVPCGTCDTRMYGVAFYGIVGDNDFSEIPRLYKGGNSTWTTKGVEGGSSVNIPELKISVNGEEKKIFEAIDDLIIKHNDPDNAQTDDEKKNEAKALAESIENAITEAAYQSILRSVNYSDHFTNVLKADDKRIVMYDYRDYSSLPNGNEADSRVITAGVSTVKIPSGYLVPGITGVVEAPIKIQTTANTPEDNRIPLHLPLIDIEKMTLNTYSVANYEKTEVISDEYVKRVTEWERDHVSVVYRQETIPGKEESTYTVPKPKRTSYYDSVGELKWKTEYEYVEVTDPGYPPQTINIAETVTDGTPKPTPKPGDIQIKSIYKPSDLSIVINALKYVSSCRSMLGADQNRLEHAFKSDMNAMENTQSAESLIRDTDMAKETVKLAKYNIIQQAGQAMLSHANSNTQNVLNLLD